MDLKPYIAVFFAMLFLGKFLMMDSRVLGIVLDFNEIAYVNSFCEKEKEARGESAESPDLAPASTSLAVAADNFCNTPLYFQGLHWEHRFIKHQYQLYPYTSPSALQIFRENSYPPPRSV